MTDLTQQFYEEGNDADVVRVYWGAGLPDRPIFNDDEVIDIDDEDPAVEEVIDVDEDPVEEVIDIDDLAGGGETPPPDEDGVMIDSEDIDDDQSDTKEKVVIKIEPVVDDNIIDRDEDVVDTSSGCSGREMAEWLLSTI